MKRFIALTILVVIGGALVALILAGRKHEQQPRPQQPVASEQVTKQNPAAEIETPDELLLREMISRRASSKPPAGWWLKEALGESTPKGVDLFRDTQLHAAQVRELLQKYKSASPLAAEVAEHFSGLKPGMMLSNGGLLPQPQYLSDRELSVIRGSGAQWPEQAQLFYIPQSLERQHPGSATYEYRWHAVLLPAIDYPPAVLAGLAFNAFGFAYQDRAREGLRTNLLQVEMYDLQAAVFNAASDGRFYKVVDQVIDRARANSRPVSKVWVELTDSDLEAFEHSLDCDQCSQEADCAVLPESVYALGSRYIDRFQNGDLGKKLEYYLWVANFFERNQLNKGR